MTSLLKLAATTGAVLIAWNHASKAVPQLRRLTAGGAS